MQHGEKGKTHKSRKASRKILKPKAISIPIGVAGYNDVLQGPTKRPDGDIAKPSTCITGNCFMLSFPNSPTPAGIMVNPGVSPFRGSNMVGTQARTGTRNIVSTLTGAAGKPHIPTGVTVNCSELPSGLPAITATPVPADIFMNHELPLGTPNGVGVPSSTSGVTNLQTKSVLSPMLCPNVNVIKSDHAYHIHENPKTIKRKLDRASTQLHKMKRRLRTSQQKYRRLSKRYQALLVFVESLQGSVPIIQEWSDEEPWFNNDDGWHSGMTSSVKLTNYFKYLFDQFSL